jgi:hypothetical protein
MLASAPLPLNWAAWFLKKSWSASLDLSLRLVDADAAAVRDLARPVGRHRQVHVAVGDAGLRELADLRPGALAQRRVRVVDRELDLGLAVVGDLDALDRADRDTTRLDRVPPHELAGVDEARLDAVAAGASEQDEGEQGHRGDHRADCRNPS